MSIYNLISFIGIFVLVGIAWLFSWDRKKVNLRVLFWGILLQLLFALFIFVYPPGAKVFLVVNDLVVRVVDVSTAGAKFLFGRLALPPGTKDAMGQESLGFFLAFQALPTIIFFSALISLLYYIGIIPRLVRWFATLFTRLMGISGAESLCTTSNIFVGVESTLTIKPHLEEMTLSELGLVLTAGMSSVASNILALYVFSLQSTFPTIAGHLVSASILSAPAAVVMSKMMMPELGVPKTLGMDIHPHYDRESNFVEAIIKGAMSGVQLIVGIGALLLAFLGLVALLDLITRSLGGSINGWFGWSVDWSLRGLLGYIFYPFALIMGVPPGDAVSIGKIVGERVVLTEVTSYQDLAVLLKEGVLQNPRSALIATYALCGFAHVASMAIFVGGAAALAPSRTADLSRLGFRALVAATLATLMTGAVAGTFYLGQAVLPLAH